MNLKEYQQKFNMKKSPLQAIKMKCWDCCGGSADEVKLCTCKDDCVLWPFRTGKNPYAHKRVLTEEEKEKLRKQLQNAKLARQAASSMGDSEATRDGLVG